MFSPPPTFTPIVEDLRLAHTHTYFTRLPGVGAGGYGTSTKLLPKNPTQTTFRRMDLLSSLELFQGVAASLAAGNGGASHRGEVARVLCLAKL